LREPGHPPFVLAGIAQPQPMTVPKIAICSTNYNCVHALEAHLRSVFLAFQGLDFEYAVVDNHSRDGGWSILRRWSREHQNLRIRSVRCTRGTGRNLAVGMTSAPLIAIVDTDVVYRPESRGFVVRCGEEFPNLGVQAIFHGVFPRTLWYSVDGFRHLSTYED